MARILNELSFLQETKGHAGDANHRQPFQFVPCFVPVQPLPKHYPQNYPQRRRLEIAIEVKPDFELPDPVKIIHSV